MEQREAVEMSERETIEINHAPNFDVDKVIEHYREKDGVDIKYVCTSDLKASDVPVDIFFRETPHPEFGNRYFGLFYNHIRDAVMITDADIIDGQEFAMIQGEDGSWYYSSCHHDNVMIDGKQIDGGRVYHRGYGFELFVLKDGEFDRADGNYYYTKDSDYAASTEEITDEHSP